jgi:hypothetical protein
VTDEHDAPEADLGEETRRLLGAVQDWARRTMPAPPSGHAGPECQWCPLCQFASVLRGEHPELADRLTEAGAALANAVRALGETAAARTPTPANPARRPKPRPGPRVQQIHIDDVDGRPPTTQPDDVPDGRGGPA